MDQEMSALVQELRSRMGPLLSQTNYDDENGYNLLRWLNCHNKNLEKIVDKLTETLEFRQCLQLDEKADWIEAAEYRKTTNPLILEYFPGGPGGICGFNKQGNFVYIQPIGPSDAKDAIHLVRSSEFYMWALLEVERGFRLIQKKEIELKKKCEAVIVVDMEGITTSRICLPIIKIGIAFVRNLQPHYPDCLRKIYVVNAPKIVDVIFSMVRPFVSDHNWSKLEFLSETGEKLKEKLRHVVEADQLPVHWGGQKLGKFGKYGDVNMTKIPPNLKVEHPEYESDQLIELLVERTKEKLVQFNLDEKSKVTWYFKATGGLAFGIRKQKIDNHQSRDQWVVPKWFLHTQHVPEHGHQDFEPGSYEIIFDNTRSMIKSRHVHYRLEINTL